MDDLVSKVKDKVREKREELSKNHPASPESKTTDYASTKSKVLSRKPLPPTPEHETQRPKATIRQVHAFNAESNERSNTSRLTSGPEPSKPSSQPQLLELDFNKLNLNDPADARKDAQYNTGDLSRKTKQDPNVISSIIPHRQSSPKAETEAANTVANAHRSNQALSAEQLPPGFDLTNAEDTKVHKHTAPAVVHEHIHPHRHEIVTEAITRDIHVDHYFNYIQPVKEVVIKPAVHYTINEKGEKVRLPGTPDCWEVPQGLTPTRDDERVSAITPPANESLYRRA